MSALGARGIATRRLDRTQARRCARLSVANLIHEPMRPRKAFRTPAGVEFTNGDEPGVKLTMGKRAK